MAGASDGDDDFTVSDTLPRESMDVSSLTGAIEAGSFSAASSPASRISYWIIVVTESAKTTIKQTNEMKCGHKGNRPSGLLISECAHILLVPDGILYDREKHFAALTETGEDG